MDDDIVSRLRRNAEGARTDSASHVWLSSSTHREAADLLEAQQAEIERLRAERKAIDALHQRDSEYYAHNDIDICSGCELVWPCPTHILLHPKKKEARRG